MCLYVIVFHIKFLLTIGLNSPPTKTHGHSAFNEIHAVDERSGVAVLNFSRIVKINPISTLGYFYMNAGHF